MWLGLTAHIKEIFVWSAFSAGNEPKNVTSALCRNHNNHQNHLVLKTYSSMKNMAT